MKFSAFLKLLFVLFLVALSISCSMVEQGVDVLAGAGKINSEDARAITKASKAVRKTFSEITEEEEYYIGRAVSALILSRYPVYRNDKLTRYVNTVGTAVAFYSDRPETYAGYHFLILDTDEVNAMAAPGGFIFITKGLLKKCRTEEMLSAVLAHEIGHVSAKHGLRSIKKSRLIDAFKIIGQEAARKYASEDLQKLTSIFEGVLGDVVETLIEKGYDRKYEYEADRLSVSFALRIKYNPNGLKEFLEVLDDMTDTGAQSGWFKTHPSAKSRLDKAGKEISSQKSIPVTVKARTSRFLNYMKGVK